MSVKNTSPTLLTLPSDIWRNCILPRLDRATRLSLCFVCSTLHAKFPLDTGDIGFVIEDAFKYGSLEIFDWLEVRGYPMRTTPKILAYNLEHSIEGIFLCRRCS